MFLKTNCALVWQTRAGRNTNYSVDSTISEPSVKTAGAFILR